RLMSQALRKLTGGLSQTNTTMIFINQLREKIGVFFGSPETTAGGKALKFYASVRLDIRRIETLKDGTDAVGNRTRVKVVKNKMAPPFKQAEFDILYGIGISREGSLIDFGVEHEIVRKSGAWYTYGGDQLGQGKENSRKFLLENPKIALEIEQKIMFKLGVGAEAKAAIAAAAIADAKIAAKVDTKATKGTGAKTASGPAPIEVAPIAVAPADSLGADSFGEPALKAVGE
ncbi:MAG: recombination protein RecA, partial [Actinomycetota bacterium]|nr:recombination protein RecA [Actinomycetota bacterium]